MRALRIFFYLMTGAFMASCTVENNPGPPGPRGPQGPAGPGTSFTTINVTAQPQDWLSLGEPGDPDFQYYVEFNAPEIDRFVFENALVTGYLIDNGTAYTLPNTVNFGNYTREFSMYFGQGYLGFVVKDSDLQTTPPADPLQYRVYITEPGIAKRDQFPLDEAELQEALRDQTGAERSMEEARRPELRLGPPQP